MKIISQKSSDVVRRTDCPRFGFATATAMFISTLAGFNAAGVDCIQAPPGLIGWWAADGNSLDRVGTNHAFLFGGATATNAGYNDRGFLFDGTNGHAAVSNSPALNLPTLTVDCWVRFDLMDTPGTSVAGSQYMIFKKNPSSSIFEGINLSKHRYTNSDIFVWEASNNSQFTELRSKTVIQQGVWYHTAGVRGSNYLALFVNGVMERSNFVSYAQVYDTKPLFFGCSGEPGWEHKLGGMLDEIGLYNRALSVEEIAAIYAAGAAGRCKSTNAPAITSHPQSQLRYWGSSVTFTSVVSGSAPLDLRWRKDNVPMAGATNALLVLTNLQLSDAGSYALVATNVMGSVTSTPAALNLKVADVSVAVPAPNFAGLTIGGVANKTYGIQIATNLSLPNPWIGLTNFTLTASTNVWSDPLPAKQPVRFYKVVPGPISIP